MRKLLVLALFFAIFLMPMSQVMACSRWEFAPIDDVVEYRDVVVSGTVDYVDHLGANFVLKVDRYFKGSGGEYISVVYWRPALVYANSVRDYDQGCLSVGWGGHRLRRGDYGYFALGREENGTYDYSEKNIWIPGEVDPSQQLDSSEEWVEFKLHWRSEYELESPAPVKDFEKLLLQLSKEAETRPPDDNNYPLMRYLKITTESGNRYRLNPDYSVTWLDPEWWPIAVSNDGSHVVFRIQEDELAFQFLSLLKKVLASCPDCKPLDYRYVRGGHTLSEAEYANEGWLEPVPGFHAVFSPDSNFVAVHDRKELRVFMFDNWTLAEYEYGQEMSMKVVAAQPAWWDPSMDAAPILWSADSTTIVFQDDRGIWHWDIFADTHPVLVLPDTKDNMLLDVSRSGRFIRLGQDDSWTLLDVDSGEIHERAIATPDERNLIMAHPSYPSGAVTARAGRTDRYRYAWRTCRAPLSTCPIHIEYPHQLIAVFDYQPGRIGLVSRTSIQFFPWYLSLEESYLPVLAEAPAPIVAFDYDTMHNVPAIAYDDFTIDFGLYYEFERTPLQHGQTGPISLIGHLDSPIVDLEWEQPVFYEMH